MSTTSQELLREAKARIKGTPVVVSANEVDGLVSEKIVASVEIGAELPTRAFGVLPTSGFTNNERNGNQKLLVLDTFDPYEVVPLSTLVRGTPGGSGDGRKVNRTRELVDITEGMALPAQVEGEVGATMQQVDAYHAWLELDIVEGTADGDTGSPWPRLDEWTEESEVEGIRVHTTRIKRSDEPAIGLYGTAGEEEKATEIRENLWLHEVSTIDPDCITDPDDMAAWMEDFLYYQSAGYTHSEAMGFADTFNPGAAVRLYIDNPQIDFDFPSFLDASEPFFVLDSNGPSVIIPNQTKGRRTTVPMERWTQYFSSRPATTPIYQFYPRDVEVILDSQIFKISNVLCDAFTLTMNYPGRQDATPGANLTYETFTGDFSETTPSTTEWLDKVGKSILVREEITRWKFNLWKRVQYWLIVPDLSFTEPFVVYS